VIGTAARATALVAALAVALAGCGEREPPAPSGVSPADVAKVRDAAARVRAACRSMTQATAPPDARKALRDCMAGVDDTVTQVRFHCIVATNQIAAGPERDTAITACKDAARER
jgi:hypothetical protein